MFRQQVMTLCIALLGLFLYIPGIAQDIRPPASLSGGDQQRVSGPAIPDEDLSIAIRWVASEYLSPETEKIDRSFLSLESFDEVAGEDIRVEVWGAVRPEQSVWLFVHDRNAESWWAYGPANREGNGSWVTHGVRFGEGIYQGRRFTLRAAMLNEAPAGRLVDAREWMAGASAISDPVYLTVKRRLIRPYPREGTVSNPQIWLSTIDHLTVSATEPMVVPSSAGVAGTFQQPQMNPRITPDHAPFIYVLIRSTAADRWRVFGPAVTNGVKWEIRDCDIGDPGEPQWASFKISAVMTYRRLLDNTVDYDDWWDYRLAASDPVEVSIKAPAPILDRTYPRIAMKYIQTMSDTLGIYGTAPMALDSVKDMIQVGGTVEDMPQSASVWLLINPVGTTLWEVHGKAIITPPSWRMPVVSSTRFDLLSASRYRLMAIVSTATLSPGLMSYEDWRRNTLAISEGVIIEEPPRASQPKSMLTLSIREVGGREADNARTVADLSRNRQVEGSLSRQTEGASIWVGTRASDTDAWRFSGPALIQKDRWNMPFTRFDNLPPEGTDDGQDRRYDIIAVATRGDLPATHLKNDELQWYALATSPVVRVQTETASFLSLFNPGGLSMLTLIILGLAALGALEYFFRTISALSAYLADAFQQLSDYLREAFSEMPQPKVIPSALGILILTCAIFAIVSYFPIYTHVLERVLKLGPDTSESLALLLIIFIGLAGVIVHLSIEYVSVREGQLINRIFDYFLNYGLPITVLLVTFALWGVQALLYLELYSNQVGPGNIRVPAAMGAAAFFIAGIETLGFYWATRLGMEFFAWLIFNVVIIGPPALLASFFRILGVLFESLPGHGEAKADAPPALDDEAVASEYAQAES